VVQTAWEYCREHKKAAAYICEGNITNYQKIVIDGFLSGKKGKVYLNPESLRPVVYLAGKYRGANENEVYENIQKAREYATILWRKGYYVLSPHLNTQFMGGVVSDEVFIAGTLELLKRCDAICMIPGWENSVGAKGEYDWAMEHGLDEVEI